MRPLCEIKDDKGVSSLQKLFHATIAKQIDAMPNGSKRAIFTGGLPASGKSTLIGSVIPKVYSENYSDFFLVDIDKFRHYLPYYEEMSKENAEAASRFSQKDAGILAVWSRNYCIKRGKDYIVDSVFSNHKNISIELGKAKEAGYTIDVHYILSSPHLSKLRNTYRYMDSIKNGENGRFVPYDYIDQKYSELTDAIEYVAKNDDIENIYIYDSDMNLLLHNPNDTENIKEFVQEHVEKENRKLLGDIEFYNSWKMVEDYLRKQNVNSYILENISKEKQEIFGSRFFKKELKKYRSRVHFLNYAHLHDHFSNNKDRAEFIMFLKYLLNDDFQSIKESIMDRIASKPSVASCMETLFKKADEDIAITNLLKAKTQKEPKENEEFIHYESLVKSIKKGMK